MGTFTDVNPTPIDPTGWRLTSFEGFNNPVLDRAAWPVVFDGGTYWNGAFQWRQQNLAVWDGELIVANVASPSGWTSGGLNMGWNGQLYGRWEVRARLDDGKGTSAAILLWPTDGNYPPEIDLLESPDPNRTITSMTVHGEGSDGSRQIDGRQVASDASDWHTYAVDWLPGRITFYIDGVARWTTTDHVPSEPMALGFMGFVASSQDEWFGGAPDASTPGYVALHVDWARIWTPEALLPGQMTPALYWNSVSGWAAPPEAVRTGVRSLGEERYAATWNAGEWGTVPAVATSGVAAWTPGTATNLIYANFEVAHLDLRAAPSALDVKVIGAAYGSLLGGHSADDITWLVHADAASGASNPVIVLDDGDDKLLVTTPSMNWLAQPFSHGSRWNAAYDGSLSQVRAYGGAGNDQIKAEGMVTLLTDGGTGNDTIVGANAADWISGGEGADDLTGGGGPDLFVYMHGALEGGDTIRDFTPGVDKLAIFEVNPALLVTSVGAGGLVLSYGGQTLAILQGVAALQPGDIIFG